MNIGFVHVGAQIYLELKNSTHPPVSRSSPDFCVDCEYAICFVKSLIILELREAQVGKNSVKFHTHTVPESCMDFFMLIFEISGQNCTHRQNFIVHGLLSPEIISRFFT